MEEIYVFLLYYELSKGIDADMTINITDNNDVKKPILTHHSSWIETVLNGVLMNSTDRR